MVFTTGRKAAIWARGVELGWEFAEEVDSSLSYDNDIHFYPIVSRRLPGKCAVPGDEALRPISNWGDTQGRSPRSRGYYCFEYRHEVTILGAI